MKNIDNLISKYQNDCITDQEIVMLEAWVKSNDSNKSYFKSRIKEDYFTDVWAREDVNSVAFKNLFKCYT